MLQISPSSVSPRVSVGDVIVNLTGLSASARFGLAEQDRIGPVGVIAVVAVAGVGDDEFQFADAGQTDAHALGGRIGPHHAAVEQFAAVAEDFENDAGRLGVADLRVDAHPGLEAFARAGRVHRPVRCWRACPGRGRTCDRRSGAACPRRCDPSCNSPQPCWTESGTRPPSGMVVRAVGSAAAAATDSQAKAMRLQAENRRQESPRYSDTSRTLSRQRRESAVWQRHGVMLLAYLAVVGGESFTYSRSSVWPIF